MRRFPRWSLRRSLEVPEEIFLGEVPGVRILSSGRRDDEEEEEDDEEEFLLEEVLEVPEIPEEEGGG